MRLFARLTWQAADPAALATELGSRLGVAVEPGGLAAGARVLRLGAWLLEVRPWIREGPDDAPRAAGRLLLEPVPDGEDPQSEADPMPTALRLHGLGWGTVELDRAEEELSMWLGPPPATLPEGTTVDADGHLLDDQLAARARLRAGGGGLPGAWTVLLEPAAEGRAAAALARDGEGPIALYLRPAAGLDAWLARARDAGVTAGARRAGPFGAQVVLPGAITGPHVLVTEGREPLSGAAPAGTINP